MGRQFLAAIAFLVLGSTASAFNENYSVHCMDTNSQKLTMFLHRTQADRVVAAFAQDEEGWPFTVEYLRATPEQISALAIPEGALPRGFELFMGASPDDSGLGLNRYLLLPAPMNTIEFTAYHGSHLIDEAIALEKKISMTCF